MSHGIYHLAPNVTSLSQLAVVVMPAQSNLVGGVMPSVGLSVDTAGNLSTLPASATQLGAVKIGSNISVAQDGTISVAAPSGGGGGSVTSVGLAAPAEFSVSGSPVTGSGVLTFAKANQAANTHYAGPASGATGAPTFRALVQADMPSGIAPQVNSDWNASSGVAQVLNKPAIPAAQVNSDWAAASGLAQILNKPPITYSSPTVTVAASVLQLVNGSNVISLQSAGTAATSVTMVRASAGSNIYFDTNMVIFTGGALFTSPDQSRYLQVSCANGGHPTLASTTGQISVNQQIAEYGAGGFVAYSPDASRYAQLNCANGANPVLYSSTGTLTLTGAVTVSSGLTVTGSISSTNRVTASVDMVVPGSGGASGYMQLSVAANGAIAGRSNPWIYSSVGQLDLVANVYHSGSTISNGNLTVNSGGINITAGGFAIAAGGMTCAGQATFTSPIVIQGGQPFYWYNGTPYGVLGWVGANPGCNSQTGVFAVACQLTISGNLTVAPTASNGLQINCPSLMSAIGFSIPSPAYGVTMGFSSGISGANNAFIFTSSPQLNISAGVLYCTGSVSATAHNTHASGTHIKDIHRAFHRQQIEADEYGGMTEHPISVGAWTLAPSDDGLHILCKRGEGFVVEHVIGWNKFTEVSNGSNN